MGKRVLTEDGTGLIVDIEKHSKCPNRYGVKLDSNGKILYYFENEIKIIN